MKIGFVSNHKYIVAKFCDFCGIIMMRYPLQSSSVFGGEPHAS